MVDKWVAFYFESHLEDILPYFYDLNNKIDKKMKDKNEII